MHHGKPGTVGGNVPVRENPLAGTAPVVMPAGEMSDLPASQLRAPLPVRRGIAIPLVVLTCFVLAKMEWRHGVREWWSGDKVKLELLVQSSSWWGAVAAVVLLMVLGLTARWWAHRWPAVFPGPHPSAPRWFWLAVACLMIAGAAVRAPRLGLSFYNDEAHAFRSHLAGRLAMADLGKPEKFRPATWLSTLYENRAGNNSMPFSIAARASYDAWLGLTGHARGTVGEAAVRLPVLVCGVLSIGAMAWLALRLGGPAMGLAAGFLTAFHPWHLRYSVEARGYGMLLLALPLLFLALHAALRTGRWRWWLLFGFMEYLSVAVWFGSAHLLVALNATLVVMAALPGRTGTFLPATRAGLLFPAFVAGCLALGLYLQFNLPLYIQLSKALADPLFFKSPDPFPLAWFQDTAGFLGFGTPGLPLNPANHAQPTVVGWLADPVWRFPALAALAVWLGGLTLGFVRLFRQGGTARALAGTFTGGAILTFLYCSAKGIVFLKWYTLFLLPGLILLLAAGLTWGLNRRRFLLRTACLVPLAVCWVAALIPSLTQSRENLRGPVQLARGTGYPASLTNPNGTLYAVMWSESPVYDPAALTLKSPAGLEVAIARARSENRPLLVSHGHTSMAAAHSQDILARLRDPTVFVLAATFPGLDDASTTHFVYQLLPAAPPTPPVP